MYKCYLYNHFDHILNNSSLTYNIQSYFPSLVHICINLQVLKYLMFPFMSRSIDFHSILNISAFLLVTLFIYQRKFGHILTSSPFRYMSYFRSLFHIYNEFLKNLLFSLVSKFIDFQILLLYNCV